METSEELKKLITDFRKNDLVKQVAKTKIDDIGALARAMSPEDKIELFRLHRNFVTHPLLSKLAIATGQSTKPKSFNPDSYEAITLLFQIKDILSSGSRAVSGKIPADVKKDLIDWVENNSKSARLDSYTISKLLAIPNIRPTTPQLVFRGMLFQKWQFEPKYQEHRVSAGPIAEALLRGQEHLILKSTNCSSWTYSKNIAKRFASSRSAGSSFVATMQWLHQKGAIAGRLGIIIATRALPNDVLVDLSKVDLGYTQHGDESELILLPGNRVAKIISILTPEGEISVHDFPSYYEQIKKDFDNSSMR